MNITSIVVALYNFAIICLMCRMVVNHGLWWILLVVFMASEGSEEDE